METRSLPETIRTIIAQAGGLGLAGAFTHVGASQFTYRCAEAEGEYRSSRPSRLVSEAGLGFVDYEVGLQARVNGMRGRAWTLIIAYEPDDTYTVWLVEAWQGRKADSMVLACHRDVYSDTLNRSSNRPMTRRSAKTTAGSFHCREPGHRRQAWADALLGGPGWWR